MLQALEGLGLGQHMQHLFSLSSSVLSSSGIQMPPFKGIILLDLWGTSSLSQPGLLQQLCRQEIQKCVGCHATLSIKLDQGPTTLLSMVAPLDMERNHKMVATRQLLQEMKPTTKSLLPLAFSHIRRSSFCRGSCFQSQYFLLKSSHGSHWQDISEILWLEHLCGFIKSQEQVGQRQVYTCPVQ